MPTSETNKLGTCLFLMVFLHTFVFLFPLSAQGTSNASSLVQFQDIQVQTGSDQQARIDVKFSTALKPGSRITMALMNAVDYFQVEEQVITVSRNSTQTITFGDYPKLWNSTYFLHCTFRGSFEDQLRNGYSKSSTPSRTVTSEPFPLRSNVPPPEKQKKQFQKRFKTQFQAYYQFLSWFYPRFRKYSQKLLYGDDKTRLSDQIEQFESTVEQRFQKLSKTTKALQNEHVFGSPFKSQVKALNTLHQHCVQLLRKNETYLSSFLKDASSKRTRRSARESIEEMRDQLLYELSDQFLSMDEPFSSPYHPAKDELWKKDRKISLQLNTLLTKLTSGEEPLSENARPNLDPFLETFSTMKEELNNLLWLFRDRETLARNEQQVLNKGKTMVQFLNGMNELLSKNSFDVDTLKTLRSRYRSLNERVNTRMNNALEEILNRYSKKIHSLKSVSAGTTSERKEKISETIEFLKRYSRTWKPFLNDLSSFLDRWSRKPGQNLNSLLYRLQKNQKERSEKERKEQKTNKEEFTTWIREISKIHQSLSRVPEFHQTFQERLRDLQKKDPIFRGPYERQLSWAQRNLGDLKLSE